MNEAALAVIRDVDRQIGELQTLRTNLARLYRIDPAPHLNAEVPVKPARAKAAPIQDAAEKKRARQREWWRKRQTERKSTSSKKPQLKHASAGPPQPEQNGAGPKDGLTATAVLNALKGGGKTSGEVIAACPQLGSAQVYTCLSVLRNQRRIAVRVDDADGGQKKNYLA